LCLSQRAANAIYVALAKRRVLSQPDLTTIFRAYDEKFVDPTDLCAQTLALFTELVEHFRSDDERLLVLVIKDSMQNLRE